MASHYNTHEIAFYAWSLAVDFDRGKVTSTERGRDGFTVPVKGGVSRLIKQAAKQAGVKVDSKDINNIREYLRARANIVSRYVNPSDNRVFVANVWGDERAEDKPTFRPTYTRKGDHQPPGGESGPVTVSNVWDEFAMDPLGEKTAEALVVIYGMGGKVRDPRGFKQTDKLSLGRTGSSALRTLEERGLIKVKMLNERTYKSIELTSKGWLVAENVECGQNAEIAVARFLYKVGSYRGENTRTTSTEIAERVHKSQNAVNTQLNNLEEQGLIKVDRTKGGYPIKATFVGKYDDLPGVGYKRSEDEPETHNIIIDNTPDKNEEPTVATDENDPMNMTIREVIDLAKAPKDDGLRDTLKVLVSEFNSGSLSPVKVISRLEDIVSGD